MKFEIKSRFSGAVLFSLETESLKLCVEAAVKARADLSGAVLRGAVLRGADLSGADLRGAVLRGAVLRGADLSGADLRGADLSGAVLRGADLRDADLRGADLSGAVLSGAVLRGADLRGADLSDADLRGAVLSGAVLRGADLRDADLRGAVLSGADLRDAVLRDADLRDADLRGAVLSDADLRDAVNDIPVATDEQAIKNLDTVRELILDDTKRLEMGHWHNNDEWRNRTCAEEAFCGTTHCLAGWLQTCSTDPKVRALYPATAGVIQAPVAARMFYRDNATVLAWLEKRAYVEQIAHDNARSAERKAKRGEMRGAS